MHRSLSIVVLLQFCFLTGSVRAQAQDEPVPEQAIEPAEAQGPGAHSINLSPLGIIFGAYKLNYEYLLHGTHGFRAEGGFAHYSSKETDSSSYAFGGGYRWHWRQRQNSGFLGVNIAYQSGTAKATVDSESFDLTVSRVVAVANIGKRWAWDFGLNITFRLGAGVGSWNVSTDSKDSDAKQAVKDVEDLLAVIPIALDGELSLGWIF